MTLAQTFHAVADLLASTGWTQRALARDAAGLGVSPKSLDAVCFCFEGAIERVAPKPGVEAAARQFAYRHLNVQPGQWNDQTASTAADAIAMARSLARRAEREGV